MALTKEQIQKAMSCKTADELIALAKSWGFEMTREQAEEYLAKKKTVELTEEELAQVAGGGGASCQFRAYCKWVPHPQCEDHDPGGPIICSSFDKCSVW